jgi:hypothetical protein
MLAPSRHLGTQLILFPLLYRQSHVSLLIYPKITHNIKLFMRKKQVDNCIDNLPATRLLQSLRSIFYTINFSNFIDKLDQIKKDGQNQRGEKNQNTTLLTSGLKLFSIGVIGKFEARVFHLEKTQIEQEISQVVKMEPHEMRLLLLQKIAYLRTFVSIHQPNI